VADRPATPLASNVADKDGIMKPTKAQAVARPTTDPVTYRFRLYLAGSLPNSVQAERNLRALCAARLPGRHRIEVVDFLEEPGRALEDGVLVTPTLLKLAPEPSCMIIGTLSDGPAVLRALGLSEEK
jgi:circadian clock protein KaiB